MTERAEFSEVAPPNPRRGISIFDELQARVSSSFKSPCFGAVDFSAPGVPNFAAHKAAEAAFDQMLIDAVEEARRIVLGEQPQH